MGTVVFVPIIASAFNPDNEYTSADGVFDQYRVRRGLVTFSASYATGGDTIPIATLGLKEVRWILIDPRFSILNDSGLSVDLAGTPSAPLLKAFDANVTEVPNTTNLSTRTATGIWFFGRA